MSSSQHSKKAYLLITPSVKNIHTKDKLGKIIQGNDEIHDEDIIDEVYRLSLSNEDEDEKHYFESEENSMVSLDDKKDHKDKNSLRHYQDYSDGECDVDDHDFKATSLKNLNI